jgi:hypothetical protein
MSKISGFTYRIGFALLAIVASASFAKADSGNDFFTITATGTTSGSATASGGTLLRLTDDLLKQQNNFAPLAGQGFNGALSYGGVSNAIQFSENPSQTSATLTIPSTGFTKTFNGTSAADLQSQIRTFIEQDGSQAYSQFLRSIDEMSPVAAIDGNPQASTAFVATDSFQRFGMHRTVSDDPLTWNNKLDFRIDVTGGTDSAAGFNGNYADLSVDADWRISDNVGLSVATLVQYRDIGDSAAYTVGEVIGIPVTLINRTGPGFSWEITPWGFVALAASYDQVSGSLLVGAGGTSSFNYQIGDFTFTVANQVDYAGDVALVFDKYHFDTRVNQWILKNGGKVSWNPWGKMLFVDGGISYSNFLHPAAVPNYWTGTAGIGLKLGRYSSLRVGYTGDFCNKYHSNGGDVTLSLSL